MSSYHLQRYKDYYTYYIADGIDSLLIVRRI